MKWPGDVIVFLGGADVMVIFKSPQPKHETVEIWGRVICAGVCVCVCSELAAEPLRRDNDDGESVSGRRPRKRNRIFARKQRSVSGVSQSPSRTGSGFDLLFKTYIEENFGTPLAGGHAQPSG